jgi:hypothetical protein
MKTILRKKTSENKQFIYFNEYNYWGFIGFKNGFKNRWFTSFIPFSDGLSAWHFLGFRFTKSPMSVSKVRSEINGWYTSDRILVEKLRTL